MGIMLVVALPFDQLEIVGLIGQQCGVQCALEVLFQEGCEESCREHPTGFAAERVWAPGATTVSLDKSFPSLRAEDSAVCHAIAACRSIGYDYDEIGILDIFDDLWQVIKINVG